VYVVGIAGQNFPTYPGGGAYFQDYAGYGDAFILKFDSNGVVRWSTYYGGSNQEWATFVTTDANNRVYVVGIVNSTNFPTYNPGGNAYFQGTNA
ncbi:MAG: hypothetical protein ABDH37_09060, partial [Candidatus Hydrothermales bacterium]